MFKGFSIFSQFDTKLPRMLQTNFGDNPSFNLGVEDV
jgi:hypothetical protein